MNEVKQRNRNERLVDRFHERSFRRIDNKCYNKEKKKIKKLYNLLLSRYKRKELLYFYDLFEVGNYWSTTPIPKTKENDKIYKIATHYYDCHNCFLFPSEDLPLMMGKDKSDDEVISWRFKIGR